MRDTTEISKFPRKLGRHKVRDTGDAFTYRMGALFAGDIGRFPGVTIDPCLISANSQPLQPGMAVVIDGATNAVRLVQAADVGNNVPIYGIVVRVYPFQQATGGMASAYGNGALGGPIADICRRGYIGVPIVGSPNKGSGVFVWAAASGGGHVQGGFEVAASAGNTIALDNKSAFNGPPDSTGIGELMFNI